MPGYGVGEKGKALNIAIVDYEALHVGTVDEAFESLIASFSTLPPYASMEAKELYNLWAKGEGYSDRAMTVCASLGIAITKF